MSSSGYGAVLVLLGVLGSSGYGAVLVVGSKSYKVVLVEVVIMGQCKKWAVVVITFGAVQLHSRQ